MFKSFKFKNIAVLAFSAFSFFSSFSSLASFAEARYTDMSLSEERVLALNEYKKEISRAKSVYENPNISRIYKEIIDANSNRLWMDDGKHDYFLRPVKVAEYEYGVESASTYFGDGYILISQGNLWIDNSLEIGQYTNTIDKIYNNSAVAFTVGHEIGHWEQNNKRNCTYEESIKDENDADYRSIEYSEGTLSHSYGGGLISFFNENLDDKERDKKDKEHAPAKVRYNNIANYITKASNGRIKISTNGNVKYDGKPLFNVAKKDFAPNAKTGYSDRARTLYVAGQIAFAIKYNVWNEKNVDVFTQDAVFYNGSQKIVMVTKNPLSGGYKIIDKFNISSERFKEIFTKFLTGDNDFINNSCNLEEKYCLQLLAYAYINK